MDSRMRGNDMVLFDRLRHESKQSPGHGSFPHDQETAMPTNTVIRPVIDSDTEAVIALWHQAGITRPWNDSRHDLAFARKGPHSTVLAAAEGTVIVGTAMIGEDGHRGWIYYVATAPDHRGQGIGRALVNEAERWLAERGIWKVQLLVRADNEQAKGFYEKLGYVDTRSTCMQKVLSAS